ncbi:MAG: hypothetical protein Q9169_005895 [Polycauliona sp. 2 TL-2023]
MVLEAGEVQVESAKGKGRYTWRIAELHKQYGPLVKINPYEIHINDPDFYGEVYVSGG